MTRVAVVTGGNRGIGFCIAKQLSKQFDGVVILTARDEKQGADACKKLKGDGAANIESHQLDITSKESIAQLKDHVKEKFGGLDVLVNNAGILISSSSGMSYAANAELSVRTNFLGTLDVCNAMFPLLRDQARVVNVSSLMGSLKIVEPSLQKKFASPKLTVNECVELMKKYVSDVKAGRAKENGWPDESSGVYSPAYSVSKLGLTVLTSLMAKELDPKKAILLNAVCPGWCKTDMGGPWARRSAETGARTPVYAALLPPNQTSPNGQILQDEQIVQWKQRN